jgi:hypothetical protein
LVGSCGNEGLSRNGAGGGGGSFRKWGGRPGRAPERKEAEARKTIQKKPAEGGQSFGKKPAKISGGHNEPFPYRYTGPQEAMRPPCLPERRAVLREAQDQMALAPWVREYGGQNTVGYGVALDGSLVLWPDWGDEAQAVSGDDVLAAGTLRLANADHWVAADVTNISFAYYPDPTSFRWVQRALNRLAIDCRQEGFAPLFPDDLTEYGCGYCGEAFLKHQPFYGQAAGDSLIEFADPGPFIG